MRIHRPVESFRFHLRQRGGEDLVPCTTRPHLLEQDVLESVRVLHRQLEARRYIGLAVEEHVGHVLRVGIQPERGDADVTMQHVPLLDDGIVAQLLGAYATTLHID